MSIVIDLPTLIAVRDHTEIGAFASMLNDVQFYWGTTKKEKKKEKVKLTTVGYASPINIVLLYQGRRPSRKTIKSLIYTIQDDVNFADIVWNWE